MRCGGRAKPNARIAARTRSRLSDRLVGEADDGKGQVARCDHHLHVDRHGIDALERDCLHPSLHGPSEKENNYGTLYE